MPIPCIVRVLVVDNDPATRNQVTSILRGAGYHVQAAEGQGVELGNSAKTLASIYKPHVVIMDLRLSDEHADDRSGLELWRDTSFSSSRCILYSAYLNQNYRITREALRQAGVEDVIGKEDSPQILIDAVERVARKNCGCHGGLTLVWPSAWNEAAIINLLYSNPENIPHELVADVFGRLFPESKTLVLKALEGTAKSSVAVTRGRAVLFQVWPDDKEPVVVKLAPFERILVESDAYMEFIQDRLVGQFSAQLQRRADFWDLGGICYSFLGSSQKSIETFATFYQQTRDARQILKPLEHFFGEVWRRHYSGIHPHLKESLFKVYDVYLKLSERLERFPIQEKTISFPGLSGPYPNPAAWILAHEADSHFPLAHQAVTHGDLHGDNLFIEKDHAWAIDFERTGMSHILRDFVELEHDIVTRLIVLPENDLFLFYQFVIGITKPISPTESIVIPKDLEKNQEIGKTLEVIQGLRKIAYEATRFEDMHEYYWGLLLDAFFGLKLVEPYSSKWWRSLLLSSLLCARLKDWGRTWPPASWQLNNQPAKTNNSEPFNSFGNGGIVTNINIGNITVGNGNNVGDIVLASEIQKSFNKTDAADIQAELKEALKQLAEAVNIMNKSLPASQVAETTEDLSKLVDEATKPTPNKKWYSVSIDGLVRAAENLGKVGEPVIKLSGKVLSLLMG